MYKLFDDTVIDVYEFIDRFNDTDLQVYNNLTNATKRDDAIGIRFAISIDKISNINNVTDENIDFLMELAEKKVYDIVYDKMDDRCICEVSAYKYDELNNDILVNAVIMHMDSYRKIKDVIKRLFDV